MVYLKLDTDNNTITLAQAVVMDIVEEKNRRIFLTPKEGNWDLFWKTWHAHKPKLKQYGDMWVYKDKSTGGWTISVSALRKSTYSGGKND